MTIEIQNPDVESAIQQHMATGAFQDVNDLLSRALAAFDSRGEEPARTAGQALIDAFAPIRGTLTEEEVDRLFARDQSPGRVVDFGE